MNVFRQTVRRSKRFEALGRMTTRLAAAVRRIMRLRAVRNLLSATDLGYPLRPGLTRLPGGDG